MSTITTLNQTDSGATSRATINTNFTNLNTDKAETANPTFTGTVVMPSGTWDSGGVDIATGDSYAINGTDVLNATTLGSSVVTSSLTSLGTIATGVWQGTDVGVEYGGTGRSSATAYAVVCGGTTATGAHQSVVGVGTEGQVLTSNGASTLPTFQDPTADSKTKTAGETINGATLPVAVYQNKTDNEFYACDANDTDKYKFIGFAITNGTDGNDISVQFSGIVSGFTGLDEGEKYYVQDDKTIGTSIGTQEILVGVAISTTELLMQKGRRHASSVASFTDAGAADDIQTSAITLGFRPTIIRAQGGSVCSGGSGGQIAVSQGSWTNGTHRSVSNSVNAGGNSVMSSNSLYIINTNDDPDEQWQVTITSVTDTGFTFSVKQKDSAPGELIFTWEAEGEL